jgi:hypothetical protein
MALLNSLTPELISGCQHHSRGGFKNSCSWMMKVKEKCIGLYSYD